SPEVAALMDDSKPDNLEARVDLARVRVERSCRPGVSIGPGWACRPMHCSALRSPTTPSMSDGVRRISLAVHRGRPPSSPGLRGPRDGEEESPMANTHKAGCICGAVQLEVTGDPAVQVYCHCNSCRGWLGAPIHAASLWPAPNVKVTKGADKLGLYKRTENS